MVRTVSQECFTSGENARDIIEPAGERCLCRGGCDHKRRARMHGQRGRGKQPTAWIPHRSAEAEVDRLLYLPADGNIPDVPGRHRTLRILSPFLAVSTPDWVSPFFFIFLLSSIDSPYKLPHACCVPAPVLRQCEKQERHPVHHGHQRNPETIRQLQHQTWLRTRWSTTLRWHTTCGLSRRPVRTHIFFAAIYPPIYLCSSGWHVRSPLER